MTVRGQAIIRVFGSWKFAPNCTREFARFGAVGDEPSPLVAFGDLSVGDEEAEAERHVLDRQGHEIELRTVTLRLAGLLVFR